MENKDILEVVKQNMAQQFVASLDESLKKEILSQAVIREIKGLCLDSDVKNLLKVEALEFAREYSQTPEVAESLKMKAREVVDDVMEGIIKTLGKELEDHIKSKYKRLLSNVQKYGDVS